eukprot:TRINITY_DN74160_c0_g1_i1.p1 TRINITY_DN74160_c0_g1~~TRINITY_DN74160_c0_g1_i1.p1  ORF type:complete len:611 (+),score=271.44 TRINITY_DN74160_c0_g1_i1:60-1892(+)
MAKMAALLLAVACVGVQGELLSGDQGVVSSIKNFLTQKGPSTIFPYFNFVDGFEKPGWRGWFQRVGNKFNPPKAGERVGIVTYQQFAKDNFGKEFTHSFFSRYYTGASVPSWEDNKDHKIGTGLLNTGMSAARLTGGEPMNIINNRETRWAFDMEGLNDVTWSGFSWMKPDEVKYASNGVNGHKVVENLQQNRYRTVDTLGVLVTESVFGAHLKYVQAADEYEIDLRWMTQYTPLEGFARLGGKATFKLEGARLRTVSIEHTNGTVYAPIENDVMVNEAFARSQLLGWRYAEKVLISSLLSMTNLVMHVKDLHLEMAGVSQAVTVDMFADAPSHPVRRMLDPFVHRSIQATNDNLRLLYDYRAAEFSLAPLTMEEQLRLIDDAIRENPLNLAEMDMENYAKVRNMPASASEKGGFWRWHYRTLKVQRMYEEMIRCFLAANYESDAAVEQDEVLQAWWQSMIQHMPAVQRATEMSPEWATKERLTKESLVRVARTLMVWLSWIHEDVGHGAAAFVYNPIHTPMSVPEDGLGIPLIPYTFNAVAYRGFVFLERAALLDEAPMHWFSGVRDMTCFNDFQTKLRELGNTDPAFSECDANGFYSCVDRVETAVSS